MIKDYTLIKGFVNMDLGAEDEKICWIELDIKDEKYISKAKEICNDNGDYYKNAWIIEMNIDEDGNIAEDTRYELFYIGDGIEEVCMLDNKEGSEDLIAELNAFLLEELNYKK